MARKIEFLKLLNTTAENVRIKITIDGGKPITVKTKTDIIKQLYPNLIGQPITISQASAKYGIHRQTIWQWVKSGYITIITPGYRMTVDEADVAYCVRVFNQQKQAGHKFGTPLLDENGLPYQIKHPDLAQKRRQQPAA